jgi:hypothetical protein
MISMSKIAKTLDFFDASQLFSNRITVKIAVKRIRPENSNRCWQVVYAVKVPIVTSEGVRWLRFDCHNINSRLTYKREDGNTVVKMVLFKTFWGF